MSEPPGSGATEKGPSRTRANFAKLRQAARAGSLEKITDGGWFRRILTKHIKAHFARLDAGHWDRAYPGVDVEERAHRIIATVARKSAAAGALASFAASAGEILALLTDGIATPIGLPGAVAAIVTEAGFTARLQVDLACDLASIYGVPFDADDVGEVATLFGLALGIDVKEAAKHEEESPDEIGRLRALGLTSKLMALEDGQIARIIGRKLLEDALTRNVVPIAGPAISARWNYVATMKLGATVKHYIRYRRALANTFARLDLAAVTDPAFLVEGVWLLATADGELTHEELLAIGCLVDNLPEDRQSLIALDRTLVDDEEDWFERLGGVPHELRAPLVEVLCMVAATDRDMTAAERRFLRRVSKVMGLPIDLERVQRLCRHFSSGQDADGKELPGGS